MPNAPRAGFALLCFLGMIAISVGACLEVVRARRGESLVSPRQLRWRMMSAVIWLIVLGSLGYAVLFLWPVSGNLKQARQFISVITGAFMLLGIALLLLLYDVWQVNQERQQHELRFNRQLTELARVEAERMRAGQHEDEPDV